LAERLLNLGAELVIGIDCFTDYYSQELKRRNISELRQNKNFRLIEGNILSLKMEELISQVEYVFHQAAQAGVRASWGRTFASYLEHNVAATQHLLEACKGRSELKKLVYASSSSIYGDAEHFPTVETLSPKPVSPYGVTKLAAENLIYLYARELGVKGVSLRYFTVYGPGQRPDMAFHRFCLAAAKGEEILLYGDGEQSRDFTYIDDIVTANFLAAEKGTSGSAYNIGGGEIITINQVLQRLSELAGELKIKRLPRALGDARHTSADVTLAKKELGYLPTVKVRDGLKYELEWIKQLVSEGICSGI